MLAPAPPRCCTRSSTRNDSETFSIWPSTNCSVKVPGKVIRWSVAMEPVTTTVTRTLPGVCSTVGPPSQRRGRPDHPPAAGPVGGSVRQGTPQGDPELPDGDRAEQHPGRRPGEDDDLPGTAQQRQHPGPSEGEAGHRHPGRPLPDRQGAGLGDPGLAGAGAQVVREPA